MIQSLKYIIISLFVLVLQLQAQDVRVFADTDSTEYIVGDYITYSLELRYPKGITVTIPSVKDSIDNLDFIKEGKTIKEESDTEIYELHQFIFSRYDSNDVIIPAYNIAFTSDGTNIQNVRVNQVSILVKTIEVDAQADIQDVKAPIRIPLNWLLIIIIISVLLIIVAASYFGYRYYKKKHTPQEQKEIRITILPFEKALNKLSELDEKKLWQRGMVKKYHSEITEIIRDYFEERFHFQALEMTTPEIIASIKSREVTLEVIAKTEEFLANADMVKFAKFKPMPTVNEEMMKEACFIVDNTKNKSAETELAKMSESNNAE